MKLLTIGIPVFNRFELFTETLKLNVETLLEYTNEVELLLSDNGSDSNVKDLINHYAQLYPNLVRNIGFETNKGFSANYFNILENCSTEYLWVIGTDDYLINDTFSLILDVIKSSKSPLYYTNHNRLNLRSQSPYRKQFEIDKLEVEHYDQLSDYIQRDLIDPLLGSLTTSIMRIDLVNDLKFLNSNFNQGIEDLLKYYPHTLVIMSNFIQRKVTAINTPVITVCDGAREWSSGDNSFLNYWNSSLPYVHFLAAKELLEFLDVKKVSLKYRDEIDNMVRFDTGRHFIKLLSFSPAAKSFKVIHRLKPLKIYLINFRYKEFHLGLIIELVKTPFRIIKSIISRINHHKKFTRHEGNGPDDIFM